MQNTTSKLTTVTLVLAAMLGACDDDPVDLGHDGPVGQLGSSLTDYAGTWEGYVEAYEWRDGTDAVRLSLDAAGDGTLEVGDSAPLPPPDADHGYPPTNEEVGPLSGAPQGLFPGFSYPIEGAVLEGHRIRLSLWSREIFRDWCELLPPVLDTNHTEEVLYRCLPNVGFSGGEDGCFLGPDETPIDCAKLACVDTCFCDETSCRVAEGSGETDVELDAALASGGEELVGTLLLDDRITVRMTRSD